MHARALARSALVVTILFAPALAQTPEHEDALRIELLEREILAVRNADAIVRAHLDHLEPSVGIWCGILVTRQVAVWTIDQTLSGAKVEGKLKVGHLLVAGSPLVATNAPFLRPDALYPGVRAHLFVTRSDDGLTVADGTYGVRLIDGPKALDPDKAALLRLAVQQPVLCDGLRGAAGDRTPRCIELNEVIPIPTEVPTPGMTFEFVPRELEHDRKVLRITSCKLDGDRATMTLEIQPDHVLGSVEFARVAESWSVVRSELHER